MDFNSLTFAALLGGYVLGSIPFGLFIAKLGGQGDVRAIGSGNIGATNVLRTGRKDLAALTLLFDAGKAALALILARHFAGEAAGYLAGAAALVGHCFPLWLKFKGGKGVATYFGFLFAAAWPLGLIAGAVWLLSAFATRMSSLSALLAAIAAPIAAYVMGNRVLAIVAAALTVLVFIRHRENIGRILSGTETKIGSKK